MGPKQPSKTETTTKVELPEWVDKASQGNYELADQIANKPLVQYGGPTTAGTSEGTQLGYDLIKDNVGSASTGYNAASDLYKKLAGSTVSPGAVTTDASAQSTSVDPLMAAQLKDADISDYMNPYVNSVVDTSLSDLDRQRQLALQGNAAAASAASAFGGSRSAIVDAVTNSETARQAGTLSAKLRADAFDKAMAAASGDIDRVNQTGQFNTSAQLQSDTANANRDLTAQQTNISTDLANQKAGLDARLAELNAMATGAAGLSDTATKGQQAKLGDITSLLSMGQGQSEQSQREIDAKIKKFLEARDYDKEGLNIRLAALGMSPYGKTENSTTTQTGGSSGFDPFTGGLGLLSVLGGFI